MRRQIVLDTETTGLEPSQGHRIIEIGAVELLDRRLTGQHFHQYLNPDRDIDEGALAVHGITREFLQDKPRFKDIADEFLTFIGDAELIIHNAPFDIGFINHELRAIERQPAAVDQICTVLDSLTLARQMFPGQRNSLDALCKRFAVDNSQRSLHGALLDAEILADVYLAMTGGQVGLSLGEQDSGNSGVVQTAPDIRRLAAQRPRLAVIEPSAAEWEAHQAILEGMASGGKGSPW